MTSWHSIISEATELRHSLHQNPELTWQEAKTAELVRGHLTKLKIPWKVCAKYGTIGTIAADKKGKHIALRADIDALPVLEKTNLPYKSKYDGLMHACGHDGHTAALWAAASWLKQHEKELSGPVSLFFQPAEEGGHGAREMIADGALEGIDEIYGWHNWPVIPYGQAVCPDGPVMSGNGTFEIKINGRGGHASQPEVCSDPVLAAAAITMNLQQIISRRLAPQKSAVVSVSSIDAPSSPTVTPETARIGGSIRLGTPELRDDINRLIIQISEDTARTYGVNADVKIFPRYDATINHRDQALNFRSVLEKQFGSNWEMSELPLPVMASEDFSYYLKEISGAYALIGMAENGHFCYPCHSPLYEFNDQILGPVVSILVRLAGGPKPD